MNSVLNEYLISAKSKISNAGPVVLVIGNEAADLDSMASAVTYAYFLEKTEKYKNVIPLINIPSADFKLRTEAVFLFEEAGIDSGNLISIEDTDINKIYSEGNLKLILTDHNSPGKALAGYKDAVVEIIDHHADEKNYPAETVCDIRPVGSACTIVAENFLSKAPSLIDKSIGTLLLGTILLDTVNLDPKAERVKPEDEKAAEELIKITGIDKDKLFEKIQFEKFNVSSLGTYDLLRKDYKEWDLGKVKCGIASVLMSASDWLEKDPDIVSSFEKFRSEKNLDILFAMNAFTEPEFTRNLFIYTPDQILRKKVVDFLEGSDLGLEKIDTSGISSPEKINVYNQKNLGISRKKLQPLLKDFFENNL